MLGILQLLPTLPPGLAVKGSSHLNDTRVCVHHPVTIKDNSEAFPSQPRTGPKENQKDRYALQTEEAHYLYGRIVTSNE